MYSSDTISRLRSRLSSRLSLADLAAEPFTSAKTLKNRAGSVRGSHFGSWAKNLRRRFGNSAADDVRSQLGLSELELPDAPTADQRLPGWMQVALTDAITQRYYGSDLCALETPALEDGLRGVGRIARVVLRRLGPARLLSKAEQLHRHSWDIGAVTVMVTPTSAQLTVAGSELFTERTWLGLQLMALRGAVELTGRTVTERYVQRISAEQAEVTVTWR